jgi:hypothetical protein
MRSNPLILFFCFVAFHAIAQAPDAGQQFIKGKCVTEHVSLPLDSKRPLFPPELKAIIVLDRRSDTSRIGLINDGEHNQKEMLFHAPVAEQLNSYLNAGYTNPKGKHELLIIVKDLWISESTVQDHHLFATESWDIAFRFEAYLKDSGRYFALTYLDTVLMASGMTSRGMAEHNIPGLISVFMDKIAVRDLDVDIVVKRPITWDQIDSFCRSRFDSPIDTAKKLVKGVYANLDEFRNNQPSVTRYELSQDRSGSLEVRIPDENGQLYYTHTAWGLCDGHQQYLMMDGNLFPIFFVHHQFYVLGSKVYKKNKLYVPSFLLFPGGPLWAQDWIGGWTPINLGTLRSLRLFRLDAKTGQVIN